TVDHLERSFPVAVLDRGDVHQVIVGVSGRVPQPGHHVQQRLAPDVYDRVAARLKRAADRGAESRAQRVDRGVHAERNWWTEIPPVEAQAPIEITHLGCGIWS